MGRPWANWGELPVGESVTVFDVINTQFRHLFVIAKDAQTAMSVAQSSGHIRGTEEIHNDYYFRSPTPIDFASHQQLGEHADAIQVALNRRLQGTLHLIDGQVVVGNEVILK